MKKLEGIGLKDVQAVYGGAEGILWELIMGEQVHIGGLKSSMDLADKAGIKNGMTGVDLCCCTGAGMRFLVRFKGVALMTGVDATKIEVEKGRKRCKSEGTDKKIKFVLADVCISGLPDKSADFIWGEDAWCYVEDKARLIYEAARIVKDGGTIAFTDWVEGNTPMTDAEATRFLTFMKFPNMLSIPEYRKLLEKNGCEVLHAENTKRFAPCIDLYLQMLDLQQTYDALRIIGFDSSLMGALAGEMVFAQELAHKGKLIQGLFVAKKG
jgi:ubiquinone/menaquinone biosynthesis C-methylase UbiE